MIFIVAGEEWGNFAIIVCAPVSLKTLLNPLAIRTIKKQQININLHMMPWNLFLIAFEQRLRELSLIWWKFINPFYP
ncbi:hypothetical protein ACH19I_01195 [Yersinia kristensenii]